jgi:uncharacterized radical SAM protein YgiQ
MLFDGMAHAVDYNGRMARFLPQAPLSSGEPFDVVLVTGDAYVDHPAFGAAIVGRHLESLGYRVGIIAQPPWKDASAFAALGRPRLFFGVTAGNLDSMVANYTPDRRRRESDAYSPGGRTGLRPDLASVVYAQRCREAFPGVPVVLGGIEASLRRLSHYDFVQQKVRGSVLADAKADALVYGMGERAVADLARHFAEGGSPEALRDIAGIARLAPEPPEGACILPSAEDAAKSPDGFLEFFRAFRAASLSPTPPALAQPHGKRWVVVNPPAEPLSPVELDALYRLPFERAFPPEYAKAGGIPAIETVRTSVVTHRGCSGGCAFCALGVHQGKTVVSRPPEGVVEEVRAIAARPGFGGTIQDVGGPTANMYGSRCARAQGEGRSGCSRPSCLFPKICADFQASGEPLRRLLAEVRRVPGVRHAFVASGLRHDLLLLSGQKGLFRDLVVHHVGGRMKVAPEHVAPGALRRMGKPGPEAFERFVAAFETIRREAGRDVQLVPYLIAGHPGTTMDDAAALARYARERLPAAIEHAQQFTPTPSTAATCMFVTGRDPDDGQPVHVPSGGEAKVQKAMLDLSNARNAGKTAAWGRREGRTELVKDISKRSERRGR